MHSGSSKKRSSTLERVITFALLAVVVGAFGHFVVSQIRLERYINESRQLTEAVRAKQGPGEVFEPNYVTVRFGSSSWSGVRGGRLVPK